MCYRDPAQNRIYHLKRIIVLVLTLTKSKYDIKYGHEIVNLIIINIRFKNNVPELYQHARIRYSHINL